MDSLPIELHIRISFLLKFSDILSLTQISTQIRKIYILDVIWAPLLKRDFNWENRVFRGKSKKKKNMNKEVITSIVRLIIILLLLYYWLFRGISKKKKKYE